MNVVMKTLSIGKKLGHLHKSIDEDELTENMIDDNIDTLLDIKNDIREMQQLVHGMKILAQLDEGCDRLMIEFEMIKKGL